MSIKERCTQENWSVFCGPPRCQHLREKTYLRKNKKIKVAKKPLEKTYLRKKH